jgi:hypothetical protein
LRNRFVVGAGSTYAVNATGGSADAIVVSHTHSATVTDSGHTHNFTQRGDDGQGIASAYGVVGYNEDIGSGSGNMASATTGVTVANSTTGSSGTNANLPPYFALAYIMKA